MATTAEWPEPPGSMTVPPPPPPPRAGAAAVLRRGRLRRGLRPRRGLLLQALDVGPDAGRHLLELALQALDLGLVLGRLRHQLGGGLLVGVELDPAVLDLQAVVLDAVDGVDVAVAEPLHHVELRDQVVEVAGGEQHVHDAHVARLVDVEGAGAELLVGHAEVVLGDLEQALVLLDLPLDRLELRGGLVVLLDRHVGLVVHGLEASLHLGKLRLLAADGGGECGGSESEGEKEGAEQDRDCDDPSFAVHCIASLRADLPVRPRLR